MKIQYIYQKQQYRKTYGSIMSKNDVFGVVLVVGSVLRWEKTELREQFLRIKERVDVGFTRCRNVKI